MSILKEEKRNLDKFKRKKEREQSKNASEAIYKFKPGKINVNAQVIK